MMPLLRAALLAAGGSLAGSIVTKATVTAALGLAGAWLARRNRAAVRHALLAAVFAVLLALPAAGVFAPPVRVAIAGAQGPAASFAADGAGVAILTPAGAGAGEAPASRPAGLSWSSLLLAAWIAGMALCLVPAAAGLWQVRGLRRSGLPWREGQRIADGLAADAGIAGGVEVLLHEAAPGPITSGFLHPAILLPIDAQGWDTEDLHRALVHELEHVRRRDWAVQCAARAVCALYWFHPLVWIAWRQLTLEAERSCDDAVLDRSEATAYADQLVGLARRLAAGAKPPLLAMANRADLGTRVHAVLDAGQRRGPAGRLTVALACAGAAVLLAMSPVQVVAAPQAAGAEIAVPTDVRLRTDSMLVVETVTVAGANGQKVEGLTAGDFVVTEDGVPQKISLFEFQKPESAEGGYYILGYYARMGRADGAFRSIRITCAKEPAAKLEYRSGYYARALSFPEPAEPRQTVTATPLMKPPVLLYKKEPAYTEKARKAKYQGRALLSIEIDSSGRVTNARMVRSLGLGLDENAIEAVRQWRFRPAMKDGQPVAVTVRVEVNFRLM